MDTEDWTVIGYVGPRGRPRCLALKPTGVADGRGRLSGPLAAGVAVQVGRVIAGLPDSDNARAEGEVYVRVDTGLVVEVLARSGRHGTLTAVRVR